MITIQIRHRTNYQYRQPVALGPHRLMLRPRESRELRLISYELKANPSTKISWAQDVFGNAVATATFQCMATTLTVESSAVPQLESAAWPVFDIAASAIFYPFQYTAAEFTDLGALLTPQYLDPERRLERWAQRAGSCIILSAIL